MRRLMIIRKGASVIAAAIGVAGTSLLPVASADTLPNGYTVTCTPSGSSLVCNFTGCPRVNGDEAGDVLHLRTPGNSQEEISKDCNNAATETFNNIPADGLTISVQGCRKHPLGSDDCGAWSDYKYTPPAKPAAPAAPAPAPDPNRPVRCTGDGRILPPGSDCGKTPAPAPAAAPVTNAIQLSFGPPHIGGITATVSNSSDLTATCSYHSTPIDPGIPDFTVGPHASANVPIKGFNTGTSYHVTVSCHDASGKQTQEIGHAETNVTF
ncbi:hypothetical protein [Mycobacterium paraseoulense]|uniref:Fibronectin type-III domain-containing protein n=1 Tax=Mycobacterium paraseoulense TaxID=590652 RepID=A0A1X0IAS3_9MYCO|nr:hypothetical protein [Mycobacterium paraseoulense]MCV7398006.1 hypothetical protein [Mycobacterium paraseoulense]ORB41069.1 hypothetical protein BST39_12765 [Mycobacterium paraseoulense]BBZ70258.1 hypothetical protein MPRS_13510 [Mycobacterium paraseoulense]